MKNIKILGSLVFCSILLLSSERSLAHGGIIIDGDCSSDWGTAAPSAIHATQVVDGAGGTEWVYRGEAGDARDDLHSTTSNNDIVEVRFTGDDTSLYFCVKMADITDLAIPNLNLAIDIDQLASDEQLILVGDETCSSPTACGGAESYVIADSMNFAERQYNAHNDNNHDFSMELAENMFVQFDFDPGTWVPIGGNTAAASTTGDSVEGKINWGHLGCSGGPCGELHINLTTYRNVPLDNAGGDTTEDLGESDGVDTMGGASGVTQNAWERDFSDGELSNFYTVQFDPPTAIRLQTAEAAAGPDQKIFLAGGIILCLLVFARILRRPRSGNL